MIDVLRNVFFGRYQIRGLSYFLHMHVGAQRLENASVRRV